MKDNLFLIFVVLLVVVIVIVFTLVAYLISTSDLPDWFKFWLLK